MNRRDFQSAVPPIPAHFVHAVDAALAQIGRAENTHVHRVREKHLSRRILIAAAALLLLAGMALAVGARFGILDFYNDVAGDPIVPLEGAETAIQSDVARLETANGAVITVEEAAWSGSSFTVVTHLVPAADAEGVPFPPDLRVLNAEWEDLGSSDQSFPDGSVSWLHSGRVLDADAAPQVLECALSVQLGGGDGVVELPFEIRHSDGGMVLRLLPRNAGERWSVVSAEIDCGSLESTLDVRYRYEPLSEELMGVSLRPFTAEGEEIPWESGSSAWEEQADGTLVWHVVLRMQSMDAVPETLILQPKVIDSYEWLEPVVCDVETECAMEKGIPGV